jgi:hypothetical protein
MNDMQKGSGTKAVKVTALATSAVVLLLLQVVVFSVVTDLMTSLMLFAVGFVAGRMAK